MAPNGHDVKAEEVKAVGAPEDLEADRQAARDPAAVACTRRPALLDGDNSGCGDQGGEMPVPVAQCECLYLPDAGLDGGVNRA